MNPSSNFVKSYIYRQLLITAIFGIILLIPFTVAAQEVTEEPQVEETTVTDVVQTEVPEVSVGESVATTEPTITDAVTTTVATEPVNEQISESDISEPNQTTTETVTEVEVTQEPVAETTMEPTLDSVIDITEEAVATEESSVVVIQETTTPELTSIVEDFEAWTGEYWTVTDWSIGTVDDDLALVSTVNNAIAQLISLEWTDYNITVDLKIEAESTLTLRFEGYDLSFFADGTHQLTKNGELVAAPPVATPDISPKWHQVSITHAENLLTILVDNVPQYGLESTNSLLGIFSFVANGEQSNVAIDNVTVTKIETSEDVINTPTSTPEIIDNAESTEEAVIAESTEEAIISAEVTQEAAVAESTEQVAIIIEEPTQSPEYVTLNFITEDFENDLSAWITSANIVEVAEGNHVLLMGAGGQLAPVTTNKNGNLAIAAQANIIADGATAGSVSVIISDKYFVEISTSSIQVIADGETLATVEHSLGLNTWFNFVVQSTATGITVTINDVQLLEYSGELNQTGQFALVTNSSIMLDNLMVNTLSLSEANEPAATPSPEASNTDVLNKIGGAARELMTAYLDGGEDAVTVFLANSNDPQDDTGRLLVNILVSDGYTGEAIAKIVTDAGGEVTRVYDKSLEAYVNVSVLLATVSNEGVYFIRDITRAVSTGPTAPVGTSGDNTAWSEAFNLLSIEEWNRAGIEGDGVKIGVIDTGFQGAANEALREGNLTCLESTIMQYTPDNSGALFDSASSNIVRNHGTQIIEVICDIAPAADAYMFRADDATSLGEAINEARDPSNRMDVILITMDLGVNTSAGGGKSGSLDNNIYGLLEAAKNDGIIPIVAAGNNNLRTLVLEIPPNENGETITIDIQSITVGDQIKFGWNDFNDDGISIVTFDVALDMAQNGSNDDTASSNGFEPTVNPISLVAPSTGNATLKITPSDNTTQTVYLQVQIAPVAVSAESSDIPTIATAERSIKFKYDTLDVGTLNVTDITDTVGNLGRPADSDHVISVGAICTRGTSNPTRWEFSSNGPRFNNDGTPLNVNADGIITQAEAKPSIMSYSFVSVFGEAAEPEGDPPVDGLLGCTAGLGGTSTSAAHVAGMVALLMSNDDNTSFDTMNVNNANSSATFTAIRNYLQSHAIDMPFGAAADGFDTIYGAGISVLGAPTYNLNDTVNLTTPADSLPESCQSGTTYYVGQGDMDNTILDGSISGPFTSIAAALNEGDPNCIVIMPGEYVTPIVVDNAYTDLLVTGYNDVSRIDTQDVIFWLRNLYYSPSGDYVYGTLGNDGSVRSNYRRRAGLYFTSNAQNVEFSGLTYVLARVFDPDGDPYSTSYAQAVIMDGSTNTTISNSQFGAITLNGIEYPGWVNIGANPVMVLNGTQGARIENNIFNDNSATSLGFYPTMAIIGSGGDNDTDPTNDNPIVVIGNEIYGNTVDHSDNTEFSGILYSDGSAVDIINNAIYNNVGETIIKVATDNPRQDLPGESIPTYQRRARIVGNVLFNNTTAATQGSAGALINARYTPMLYIINNTMISNTIGSGNPFGQLIARGNKSIDTASISNGGSNAEGMDFWEIHNNLIYKNVFRELVGDTATVFGSGSTECPRIPNDINGTNLNAFIFGYNETFNESNDVDEVFFQRGAQNNWIVGNENLDGGAVSYGDCSTAISASKLVSGTYAYLNQNMINSDFQFVNSRSVDDNQTPQNCSADESLGENRGSLPGDFQGLKCNPQFDETEWQYYALTQTYLDLDNNTLNEYSDGIDAGKDQWLSENGGGEAGDPYLDNAELDLDIVGATRIIDVNNWVINWNEGDPDAPATEPPRGISGTTPSDSIYKVDIGAFEYNPLQFATNDSYIDSESGKTILFYNADDIVSVNGSDVDPVTAGLLEDAVSTGGIVTFDLSTIVTGGFGEIQYAINENPNNYGTQCGVQFDNTKGLVQQGPGFEEFFDYCVPLNFYTTLTDNDPDNDFVGFKISAQDEAGASASIEIRFTIDPVNDAPFPNDNSLAIGDDSPVGDDFEIVTIQGASIPVRLRPYVRFNNFFFSENNNDEYLVGNLKMVDYPFQYQITSYDNSEGILDEVTIDTTLTDSPIYTFDLIEAQTGVATITYTVTDANGNESQGNILRIRTISIIPNEGLFDDTSFIWNYSDGINSEFYTQLSGYESTETPKSGDWLAIRQTGAINDTVHTTESSDDTATFRFRGTGFTLYMRNGSANRGEHFEVNIYDDENTIFSTTEVGDGITDVTLWSTSTGSDVVKEATNGTLTCTTRATIEDVVNGTGIITQQRILHSLNDYTINCDGLSLREHTVQVVNTGGGSLSVDAFGIINDANENFVDANPIPPGIYDVDSVLLRNAFDSSWIEAVGSKYSNGLALLAPSVPSNISFTITEASGFAIGSSISNTNNTYKICVDDDKELSSGICTTIDDNIAGEKVTQVHHPFFGLNPSTDYTVTLTNLDSGFVFDDLIVFDSSYLPTSNLPLGRFEYTDTRITLGEPFGDDWEASNNVLVVNDDRSAVGPFISFQMDDEVDGLGIQLTNDVPPPYCSSRDEKLGNCPVPPPSGLGGLQICVNRALDSIASDTDADANCIVVETINKTYSNSTTSGSIDVRPDGTIIIDETLFDSDWGANATNTVEIFSLTEDDYLEFESIQLFSSEILGVGTYQSYASGIKYVDFNTSNGSYTEVEPDEVLTSFINRDITRCLRARRDVCLESIVVGSVLETSGVGDAILFKMRGTGVAPLFTESSGSRARICWLAEANVAQLAIADIAQEIQDEAPIDGGCREFDNDGSTNNSNQKRPIYGLTNDNYWVMIELLPGIENSNVAMAFDGVEVFDNDWESLVALEPTGKVEPNYTNRFNDNKFNYLGEWERVVDTRDQHSGTGYDLTIGDISSGVVFQTSGGTRLHIVRDLQSTQVICDQRDYDRGNCNSPDGNIDNILFCSNTDQRRGNCPEPKSAYADVMICVAPLANPNQQSCSTHQNVGNGLQQIIPISLPDNGDYVVSISTKADDGFVFDGIELIDETGNTMVAGIYEEDSSLLTYGNGVRSVLKNPSLEDITDLPTTGDWNWTVSSGVSSTVTTERSFVGRKSAIIDDTNVDDALYSEVFSLISGERYTITARVYVSTPSTSVDMDLIGSNSIPTQTTQDSRKWELLRYTFVATASSVNEQIAFTANDAGMTFYVDDVNVYQGDGYWSFEEGGLNDGQIAQSNGYGAITKFAFDGTGFMVKLASDSLSGETQVCYSSNSDMSSASCMVYDNQQPVGEEPVCSGRGRNIVCTVPLPETANNGHSVIGLSSGIYYVTVEQFDNGLRSYAGPDVCTGSGRREVCIPGPAANTANAGETSVKLDYVEIYEETALPILGAGIYNEDSLSGNLPGLQLYPSSEWSQTVGNNASTYTGRSYYRVNDENAVGSLIALAVENDEATTIIIDINEYNTNATQLLACIDEVDGYIYFNGTYYDVIDDDGDINCTVTKQASTQNQVMFDITNLPMLDGTGTDRTFMLSSLTKESVAIDGYQIIHGTTLIEGFYEDTLGLDTSGSTIYTMSNISSTTNDWQTINFKTFTNNTSLASEVPNATLTFSFEGTGVSIIPGTGQPVEECINERRGVCLETLTTTPSTGQLDINLNTAVDGDGSDICAGSCIEELGAITNQSVTNGPITIAGLPYGVYTVTITAQLDAGEAVSVDAIEIYGDLQQLGSLYDDAQVDINGDMLLTFGPNNSNWRAVTGAGASYLNRTYHQSSDAGSVVSFSVGAEYDTQAIIIYDGDPNNISNNVEVCWSPVSGTFSRSCESISLDDSTDSIRVEALLNNVPTAGNYNVSIINKVNGQPMVIDAIQVIEDGIYTEGIYEETFFSSPITSTNDALNGSAISLDNAESLTFTFEGVAFSAQIVENSTNYTVCAYLGNEIDGDCLNDDVLGETITTQSNNALSALTYAGFTDTSGLENADGRWTVVITNADASNPLLIDRIDILGGDNTLFIDSIGSYEAGEVEIRYLPFGSWIENTSFKNGTPYNNNQYETALPGSVAYFEFGGGTYGIDYIRQIQEFETQPPICIDLRRGTCYAYQSVPPIPAHADAQICYGEIGDPDPANTTCVSPIDNSFSTLFQYSDSAGTVDCSNGCWGYVEYGRGSAGDSLVTLDYIRLYDPNQALAAGVYQENHPSITYSITSTTIEDDNALVGFYKEIERVDATDEYIAFPFVGTGFEVRTYADETDAEDISLCVYDYTGEGSIPEASTVMNSANCLRTYNQQIPSDGFVTRSLHGLHPGADYLAIIKMADNDGTTTKIGLDQIIIYDQQWFDENDLTDSSFLNELEGGETYSVNFKTRDTDRFIQYIGDSWQTITLQEQIGCADKRCNEPIFRTYTEDRGSDSGTTALFRTVNANAFNIDLFVNGTGDVQMCAIPMTTAGAPYEVDLSQTSNCQTYTITGRSDVSFIFNESSATEHVVTVELLTSSETIVEEICLNERRGVCLETGFRTTVTTPWMNIFEVSLYDIVSGIMEGQYGANFAGIRYNSTDVYVINETMETNNIDWQKLGSSTVSVRSQEFVECTSIEIRNNTCPIPEPKFNGDTSRKVVGGIGQGIEFIAGDGNGVELEQDTYYTVIAHVYIDSSTNGTVTLGVTEDGISIPELDAVDLTTSTRGAWQTLRATFKSPDVIYDNIKLQLTIGGGQTTFYVDDVQLISGGLWEAVDVPIGPDQCTGSGRRQVCEPGDPIFDSVGGKIMQSRTPGSSLNFTFIGTGFELGLLGGNRTGDVQVCYNPESDDTDVNCFTYSQDDGVRVITVTCVRERRGECFDYETVIRDSTSMYARGIVGLPSDTWEVTVREMDDGYTYGDPTQSRQGTEIQCVAARRGCENQEVAVYKDALIGIDYVNIYNDTDVVSVPTGVFNENATDELDNQYLALYPETKWKRFTGTNLFSERSYFAPADGSSEDDTPGPAAMLQIDVSADDDPKIVVFQVGLQPENTAQSILLCVDETNGYMSWDGDKYVLSNSDNCKLETNVGSEGQISVTTDEISALGEVGTHTIYVTSVSPDGATVLRDVCVNERRGQCTEYQTRPVVSNGNLRIDGYQIYEGGILKAGLHNEILPSPLMNFSGNGLDNSSQCDSQDGWCFTTTKTRDEEVCLSYRGTTCRTTGIQAVTRSPYLGGAAITAQEGATLTFKAQGTGFSIITDVDDNGLDFRVCYKLSENGSSFPTRNSSDEVIALQGFDSNGQPVLVSEGGVLCEQLTTDTDNWDDIMNRPLSSGAQYGFSFYGLPQSTYDVQVMVTTPQYQISNDEWFTIDAINVFSNINVLSEILPGIVDDTNDSISYEPALFWDTNITSNTYMNTDSTSTHAGSLAQFNVTGNSFVLYQTMGDMTTDVQLCVIITNDNIHCSVESERQTRIARQVTNYTQRGELVPTQVCTRFRRDACLTYETRPILENTPFTPVVFYGLGEDQSHRIIAENRVNGEIFNLDAIQVIE